MNKTRKMTEAEAAERLIKQAHIDIAKKDIKFKYIIIMQIITTILCIVSVYVLKYKGIDAENTVRLIMCFNSITIVHSVKRAYDLRIECTKLRKTVTMIENNEVSDLVKRLEEKGYNTQIPVEAEDNDNVQ